MSDGLDPISVYLACFARRLAVSPHRRHRVLDEVDDHLRDTVEGLVADGVGRAEAERRAIAGFGEPDAAARLFGSRPLGVVYRALCAVLRRRARRETVVSADGAPPAAVAPASAPLCDLCGGEVPATELYRCDLSAVGEMEAPVPLVVHRGCYEMGEALLAARGTPMVVAEGGGRDRALWG